MLVAAVTMVFNEKKKLPIWLKYYSLQLGSEHCYIVDHGSTDGSTENLSGFNHIRLPRSPQDNEKRTAFISELVNGLLRYYDYVLYVDGDEIFVPDPRKFSGILDYCEKVKPDYVTSIGIDIVQKTPEESSLDPTKPILAQRSYAHYTSSMNKPNLTLRNVKWWPGFHSRELPSKFGDVFLFHLRYVDLVQTLIRLETTRDMPWQRADAGSHQKLSDETMMKMIEGWTQLPVVEGDPWSAETGRFNEYLKEFKASEKFEKAQGLYWVDTTKFGIDLIRIPNGFKSAF